MHLLSSGMVLDICIEACLIDKIQVQQLYFRTRDYFQLICSFDTWCSNKNLQRKIIFGKEKLVHKSLGVHDTWISPKRRVTNRNEGTEYWYYIERSQNQKYSPFFNHL